MDIKSLETVGLSPLQAAAYALLLEKGAINPADSFETLGTTRSNAYKVFDRLCEIGLARKEKQGTRTQYHLESPTALAEHVEFLRNQATAREEIVSSMMHNLLNTYHKHTSQPDTATFTGKEQVREAFVRQLNLREDVYFVRSYSDLPVMGFDTMHEIRMTPSTHGLKRRAIMGAPTQGTHIDYAPHKRSNLDITWAETNDYTAPVEWSATESSLLIVLYSQQPHAILITNPLIAGAFLQLWHMLNNLLQQQDLHKRLRS